jgi:hypothetical protein
MDCPTPNSASTEPVSPSKKQKFDLIAKLIKKHFSEVYKLETFGEDTALKNLNSFTNVESGFESSKLVLISY